MWTASLDDGDRRMFASGIALDVIVDPATVEHPHAAVVRITVPAATRMPAHDHGPSDAILIPLAGELLICSADGRVERLQHGRLAVVPAHERISVHNPGSAPASMLACFAPPTFVERLSAPSHSVTEAGAAC